MHIRTSRGFVPTIVIVASILAVIVSACADFEAPEAADANLPDELVAAPTLARDIQPIFSARCATSSCHTTVTQQAGMSLEAGASYAEIAGVTSTTEPPMKRVDPGNPNNSMIYQALLVTSPIPRMPLGRRPLTANQIENIRRWIQNGAPPS